MARSRFVPPYTDTLTLANGDALIVRRRLTYGEQADSYEACCRNVEQPDGTILSVPQPLLLPRAKVAAYLVDWSLAGDDVPIRGMDLAQRIAVLVNLDPEDFHELKAAIDAHEARIVAARLEEKKIQIGATAAPPISPSPSAVVGASTGSATSTPTIT